MIRTKEDLRYYMEQDRLGLHMYKKKPSWNDDIWKYEIVLRKHEYYHNKEHKNIFDRILRKVYRYRHHKLSLRYSTSVAINTCGPGLSIAHFGSIVINAKARIGKNLRIQTGVVIGGSSASPNKFPTLGDNVYLGAGAKIIGGIKIADRVAVGANAVVVKDILEEGVTYAGIPAKKVSDHSSEYYIDQRVLSNDSNWGSKVL